MSCPACGGHLQRRRLRLDHATIALCERCGHGVTVAGPLAVTPSDYALDPVALATFERDYLSARLRSYEAGLKLLGPANDRRILDYGCSYGHFLVLASRNGWNPYGYEPGGALRERALSEVAAQIHGSLDDLEVFAPFDVVTLWDVLEHCKSPDDTLTQITSLLEPKGRVLVRVPDARTFVTVRRWTWRLMAPLYLKLCHPTNPEEHFHHFTPTSVAAFGRRAALSTTECVESHPDERVSAGRTFYDATLRRGLHRLGRSLPYEFTLVLERHGRCEAMGDARGEAADILEGFPALPLAR